MIINDETLFILQEQIGKNILFNYIEKNKIEIVFLPPSILKLFPKKISTLKYFNFRRIM
jgi:hypothetical protein